MIAKALRSPEHLKTASDLRNNCVRLYEITPSNYFHADRQHITD